MKKMIFAPIYAVVIILLALLTFIFVKPLSAEVIITFSFSVFSAVIAASSLFIKYKSHSNAPLKISSLVVTHTYFIFCVAIAFFVNIGKALISMIAEFSEKFALLSKLINGFANSNILITIYSILTAIFIIYFILEYYVNRSIEKKEEDFNNNKIAFFDNILAVENLLTLCDGENKKLFTALLEDLKYSPMYGSEKTQKYDEEIAEKIKQLSTFDENIEFDVNYIRKFVLIRNNILNHSND